MYESERTRIVKVVPTRDQGLAVVMDRKGRHVSRQHLSPNNRQALGTSAAGFFEGRFDGRIWWLGGRLKDQDW